MKDEQSKSLGDSVYHDLAEPLWKNSFAIGFRRMEQILADAQINTDQVLQQQRALFVTAFNSNHSQEGFCGRAQVVFRNVSERLTQLDRHDLVEELVAVAKRASERSNLLLHDLAESGGTFHATEQSFITDGTIMIAGEAMEAFASTPDYFSAMAKLFGCTEEVAPILKDSFFKGAHLDEDDIQNIVNAQQAGDDTVDILVGFLLRQQRKYRFPTTQDYEFVPGKSDEYNQQRKIKAIRDAAYCVGSVIRVVSILCQDEISAISDISACEDPIALFLKCTSKEYTAEQVDVIKRIALAHCTHGLNSGELTARLSGSVRTTFPRGIMASLLVRSGIVHAGALSECMMQTSDYLQSELSAEEFVSLLFSSHGKLYGFGHRIHKIDASDSSEVLGRDPRVHFYISCAREAFPDKADVIDRLVEYAKAIRKNKPTLGANTDFGASVLFNCLDLSPQVASGFFTAFRIPGICANIVNELQIKSNSRKPPFPPVLPY